MNTIETKFVKNLFVFSRFSAWFTIVLGLVVITGWVFNIIALKNIFPTFVSMKANTAFAFILSGISLILLQRNYTSKKNLVVGQFFAFTVFVIGLLTLIEYLFNLNFDIDQLLFKENVDAILTASPGRMSANSALGFIIIGLSLLFYSKQTKMNLLLSQIFSLFAFAIGLLGLISYLYSQWILLQALRSTAMALHTAFLFLILSLGILASTPLDGFMKKVTSNSTSGVMLRSLIPVVIVLPAIIELFAILGVNLGLYSADLESFVHTLGVLLALCALIWIAISKYEEVENKQKEAEAKSFEANQLLQLILDSIPQRIFWKDSHLNYLGCNKPFAIDAGLSEPNEIIGKTDNELSWKSNAESYNSDDLEVMKSDSPKLNYEESLFQSDGKKLWLRTSKTPLHDISGNTIGILGTYEDVTLSKTIEETLRENEEKFRSVFENSPIGKSMTGINGSLKVNKSFCEILGYSEEELKVKNWQEITHPEDIQESTDIVQSLIKGLKSNARYEKRYIHKNGNIVWTDVSTTLQRNGNGDPIFFITTIIDITQKKEKENELILKNIVFDTSVSANSTSDTNGILSNVNPAFLKIWGYESSDEVIGKSIAEFIRYEQEALEIINSLNNTGTWAGEYSALKKDGSIFIASANASVLNDIDGKFIGYQSSVIDITDRKHAENALAVEKQTLANILEGTNAGTWDWNIQTGVVSLNDRWAEIMGYTLQELNPIDINTWINNVHPDDLPKANALLDKHFKGELDYFDVEFRQPHKNGSWIWVNARGKVIEWTEDGKPLRITGTHIDITERKQVEIMLRDEKDRIRTILDMVGDPIFVKDNDHRITHANRAFYDMFCMDENSVIGYTLVEAVPENERQQFLQVDRKVLDTGIPDLREETLTVKDLTRTIITMKTRFIDESGKRFLVGSIHDITERKQAEEMLQTTNADLEKAQSLAHIGSWKWNLVTGLVEWSDEMYKIFGIEKTDTSVSLDKIIAEAIHPEDRQKVKDNQIAIMNGTASIEIEYRVMRGNGEERYIRADGGILDWDESGKPVMLRGILQDITERKQLEEILQASQEQFRIAQDMSPDGFTILHPVRDAKGHVVDFTWVYENATVARLNGTDPEAVVGKRLLELFPSHRGTPILRAYQKVAESGDTCIFETEYSGESMTKLTSFRLVVVSMAGNIAILAQDITERKNIEDRFRTAAENLTDVIYEWDLADRVEWFGKIDALMGYDEDGFPRTLSGWAALLHPLDIARVKEAIDNHLVNNIPYSIEYRVMHKNGRYLHWSARGNTIRDSKGNPVKWIGSVTDITSRHKEEEEKNRLIAIIEQSPDYIGTADMQGNLLYHNRAAKKMVGLSDDSSMEGMNITDNCSEKFLDLVFNEGIPTAIKEGLWQSEITLKHVDGHEIPVSHVLMVHRNSMGEPIYTSTIMRDITFLKQTEEKLKNFNKELENLVLERTSELQRNQKFLNETGSLAKVGGWEIDLKANKVNWTNEVYQIHETSPEEHQPTVESGINFYTPEAIPIISEAVGKAISDGIPFDLELQIITAKKNKKWVRAVGKSIAENSKVIKIMGAFQDIHNQKLMEEELRKHRDELEVLVNEKTSDLTDAINKLERSNQELVTFNKMAVGREMRVVELKRKINTLSSELGNKEPYDLSFADIDPKANKETKK